MSDPISGPKVVVVRQLPDGGTLVEVYDADSPAVIIPLEVDKSALPPPVEPFPVQAQANVNLRGSPEQTNNIVAKIVPSGAILQTIGESGDYWEIGRVYIHKSVARRL